VPKKKRKLIGAENNSIQKVAAQTSDAQQAGAQQEKK